MKTTIKLTAILISTVILLCSLPSCDEKVDATGLWENATYLSDTTLGEGKNTVKVDIVAGEQSVTLTIKTDKETLGEALYEHKIINDPSFFNTCNGIVADWDKDKAYWAFHVDGAAAMYGVGDEKAVVSSEADYRIVYTQ